MYRSFYRLREKPFSLLPNPAFLYTSRKHRKALAKLRSGILNGAGTTVITGEVGSGKTTLIQHLMGELQDGLAVGLINNIHPRFDSLPQWVLQAFGVELKETSEVRLHRAFSDFIQAQSARQRSAVLFVDEAQNMTGEMLEELRLLTNINVEHAVFQVVLAGQPELRDVLRRPDMRQFAQRVAVEHHLQPLGAHETREYIQHRLQVAGGDPDLFDAQACTSVYACSRGTPRLINSLCDTVLQYGYEEQRPVVDGALVSEILNDSATGQLLALADAGEPAFQERGAPVRDTDDPRDRVEIGAYDGPGSGGSGTRSKRAGTREAEEDKALDDILETLSEWLD